MNRVGLMVTTGNALTVNVRLAEYGPKPLAASAVRTAHW